MRPPGFVAVRRFRQRNNPDFPRPPRYLAPARPAIWGGRAVSQRRSHPSLERLDDNVGGAVSRLSNGTRSVGHRHRVSRARPRCVDRYSYYLTAFDSRWQPVGESPTIRATPRPTGRYRPHLRRPDVSRPRRFSATHGEIYPATASTDNVGVAGYKSFAVAFRLACPPRQHSANTGLAPSSTYTYTVFRLLRARQQLRQSTASAQRPQAATTSASYVYPLKADRTAATPRQNDKP